MTTSTDVAPVRQQWLRDYQRVRSTTVELCEPLEPEDMVVQTMPDVSPTKWHVAHTTWFFETMVLARGDASYEVFDARLAALFNSYYQALGDPYPRARRGRLSRPTVAEVHEYRRHVDDALGRFVLEGPEEDIERIAPVLTLGLHHEQQHQELLLMDAKHVLGTNPLRPVYRADADVSPGTLAPRATASHSSWCAYPGGDVEVGSATKGFAFDNERPRHAVRVRPFELATHPVTCGDYLAFMDDRGYERPDLWLADGWDLAQREGWRAPLYWERDGDGWAAMSLRGLGPVDPREPVCHVSYYEADAYAAWAGCRLPSEAEWELASERRPIAGVFLESNAFHPRPVPGEQREQRTSSGDEPSDLFGNVWEWTASPYAPYPGYEPFAGELAEYNGKFMINQMVLRGGCCVTPRDHVRRTYRNFYYPHQRWMFAGFRLAR